MNATLVGPRRLGARTWVLAVTAVALAASGCGGGSSTSQQAPVASTTATIGGSSPTATATPTPSATDQQAQAYAAAVKTYNEYWSRLTDILSTGSDPTALADIARAGAFSYAVTVARSAKSRGYRLQGRIVNVYVRPTTFTAGGSSKKPGRIDLESCQDLSTNGYIDRSGKKVPRAADAAKFVKFKALLVNFTPAPGANWKVETLSTTSVASCS